jgi:2-polyprenyl-3-methyl-5-hydroxy-6-metoxy-1,4-benzoquinol methylase
MVSTITYTQCPVCLKTDIKKIFSCKDYTVSKEDFNIWECANCTLRFTQHVPDASAIGKYYQSSDYISHSDTKKGIVNRLYHTIRNYTLKSKQSLVKEATGKEQGDLLDIGAGTGAFAHTMQQSGWKVVGLEPDETARKNALATYNLLLDNPEKLYEFSADSFDALTMWHVLEHVHDLHKYLQTFHSILKKDGSLVVAVPNYTSKDAKMYGEYWAAYDVPRHLYHFSPASMKVLLESEGFTLKEMKPMWFDSFYVSMLSEQYKGGSNLIKAVVNGLSSNFKAIGDKRRCSSVIYIAEKKKVTGA